MRDQYEAYPYPPRDAELEKHRLVMTDTESLGKISHYCFNGRLDLGKGFRVLVAGGGTGDQTIYLAEQLRDHDAEVVYLDLSSASMEIAKRRAEYRELDNITWIHGSILDVEKLGLGTFDYINCCGVLMVLEDPVAGLKALKTRLKENAAMGIMVYAKYGRTGVYHMQELMRLINTGESDFARKIKNTKSTLSCLPERHCLKSGPIPLTDAHAAELEDSDWYDLFLISQDIAYTVSEIYEWLTECDLDLIDFVCERDLYKPETHITDEQLLKRIKKFPVPIQRAIAENIASTISRHRFYTGASNNTIASVGDQDNIPYFCDRAPLPPEAAEQLKAYINKHAAGTTAAIRFQHESINISLPIQKLTRALIKHIDGSKTIGEIIKSAKNDPEVKPHKVSTTQITLQFHQLYDLFNCQNLLLLRHKNTTPFKTYQQLQT